MMPEKQVKCDDCGLDWGHGYCATCGGRGYIASYEPDVPCCESADTLRKLEALLREGWSAWYNDDARAYELISAYGDAFRGHDLPAAIDAVYEQRAKEHGNGS